MTSTAIIVLSSAALLLLWGIGAHNRLVRLRSAVTQAWPAVDVQLGRRHALALEIGELLGAPTAEPAMGDDIGRSALQTLQAAARQAVAAAAHARGRAAAAGAIQSLALAEQVLNGALRPWPVLVSARSAALERAELLIPAQALLLTQHELHTQLRFVRRVFNEAVAAYNGAIDEMPTRLLAGPLGFRPAAAFQVAAPETELRPGVTDASA